MSFASEYLERWKGKKPGWAHETTNILLSEIATSLERLATQQDSDILSVVNTEGKTVAVLDDNIYELTETELAGILYRTLGFQSADRAYASRQVARELMKEYKIERKA